MGRINRQLSDAGHGAYTEMQCLDSGLVDFGRWREKDL